MGAAGDDAPTPRRQALLRASLLRVLAGTDAHARAEAARRLGVFRDDEVLAALLGALTDADLLVRRAAANALGQIGDPRAAAPLVVCLGDAFDWLREDVVEALGRLGDPGAGLPLMAVLQSDPSGEVRALAAQALGRLACREALPMLRMTAEGGVTAKERESAAWAVARMTAPGAG